MKLDLKYYLARFWRRIPYFIVVASLLTSVGITAAVILPAEYESGATLLVEPPQIPSNLAASTVQTNPVEQLQLIEQRLMTRANLLEVANRVGLYEGETENGRPLSPSRIVSDMRSRTSFRSSTGRQAATLMTIRFRANEAKTAAEVTNEYLTIILQENVEMRTNRAGDTLAFFEQEVERLSAELDRQNERLLKFQTENADALPTSQGFLQNREATLQARLDQIDRDLVALSEQRTTIIEIFERTGQLVSVNAAQTPDEQELARTRRQLDDALLIFAPANPKVRVLENKIALLERRIAEDRAAASGDGAATQQTLLDTQLADIDEQMETLEEEKTSAVAELEEVRGALQRIPANSNTLAALQRDLSAVQQQYNAATSDFAVAETGERIELLSKGQRITVIEQATAPEHPTKPNRPIIALGGAGAGVALGLGVVLLLEVLNRAISRPVELTNRLGITPLAVLPYIKTDRERMIRRSLTIAIALLLLIIIPLALYLLHSFVYPLDGIAERLANRAGFTLGIE